MTPTFKGTNMIKIIAPLAGTKQVTLELDLQQFLTLASTNPPHTIPPCSAITEEFIATLRTSFTEALAEWDMHDPALTDRLMGIVTDVIADFEPTPDTTADPPEGFTDWFNQTFLPAVHSLGYTCTTFCDAFGLSPVEYFDLCKNCDAANEQSAAFPRLRLSAAHRIGHCLYEYSGIWLPCFKVDGRPYHPATKPASTPPR